METIEQLILREETRQKYKQLTEKSRRLLSTKIDAFMRGEIDAHVRSKPRFTNASQRDMIYDVYLEIGLTNAFTEIADSYLAVKPTKNGEPIKVLDYLKKFNVAKGEPLKINESSAASKYIRLQQKMVGESCFDEWFMTFLEENLREELKEAISYQERDTDITKIIWHPRVKKLYDSLSQRSKDGLARMYEKQALYLEGDIDDGRAASKVVLAKHATTGEEQKLIETYHEIALCNIMPNIVQAYLKYRPVTQQGKVGICAWFQFYDCHTGKRKTDQDTFIPQGSKLYNTYKRDYKKNGISFISWVKQYIPEELAEKLKDE